MNQLKLHRHLPSYGTEDNSRDCRVCLSRGVARQRHRHFSTAFHRQRCVAAGSSNMECPVCQDLHTADICSTPRVKVFMSSSTCNGFWKDEEWTGTDKYHVEHEAVGGLKILGGRRIWRQLYDNLPKNVDTHLTIGLNDVLQIRGLADDQSLTIQEQVQRKVDIFMARVEAFYTTTEQHALHHQLDTFNRFSISSLLRPPQLYQMAGNPQRPGRHYNMLLDEINKAIDAFNSKIRAEHNEREGGNLVPGMDMWGLRMKRKKMQHVFSHFREKEITNMLHLVPKKQAMAAARIITYFQTCTPNPTGQYRPKQPFLLSAGIWVTQETAAAGSEVVNMQSGSGTVPDDCNNNNRAAEESEAVVVQGGSGMVPDESNNNNRAAGESEVAVVGENHDDVRGDVWTYGPMEFSDGEGDINEGILDISDE